MGIGLAIAALAVSLSSSGVSYSQSKDQAKRAEGRTSDQGKLQEQIRQEAEAAPGIAEAEARKEGIRRRRLAARQGKTLLTDEAPVAGKTILGG